MCRCIKDLMGGKKKQKRGKKQKGNIARQPEPRPELRIYPFGMGGTGAGFSESNPHGNPHDNPDGATWVNLSDHLSRLWGGIPIIPVLEPDCTLYVMDDPESPPEPPSPPS